MLQEFNMLITKTAILLMLVKLSCWSLDASTSAASKDYACAKIAI